MVEIDARILMRAQKGDVDAIAQVLSSLEPLVYYTCLQMLRNSHDAADAAQEALLKMYLGIKNFEGRAALSSWAYRISVNASLDVIRRRKRSENQIPLVEAPLAYWEDSALGPEERALRRDLQEEVLDALQQIEEGQRAAILLLEYGGLRYEEIGEALGISVGTVKSRVYRGRKALAKILLTE